MAAALGYAAHSSSGHLSPFSFTRRATRPDDVVFKVTHCGVCHSDLHQIWNEWNNSIYPVVPGFVLRIPESLPLEMAAPLLCAGITVYSPMKQFGMTERGKHMGVVGLGGLGHMAVKFAKAFGLKVTVISTSPSKEQEAKQLLGADYFLVSSNQDAMKRASKTMDYILDTVSAHHDLVPLINLLSMSGKLVFVGLTTKAFELPPTALIYGGHLVAGSFIGGIKETQDMLDFSAEKGITPIIEKITPDYLNKAIDRLSKSDVKYRFVIDFGAGL